MTDGTINRAAIFSDGTGNFVNPAEPEINSQVEILCRTGRDDAEKVTAVVDGVCYDMYVKERNSQFDYYAVTFHWRVIRFLIIFGLKKGES